MGVLVPVCLVSYDTHISRRIYDIMRSMYKLVVRNHMSLVRTHRRDPMYLVYVYVRMSRRDYHDMIPHSPICMMRRNHS